MRAKDIKADGETRYLINEGRYGRDMVVVVDRIETRMVKRHSFSEPRPRIIVHVRYVMDDGTIGDFFTATTLAQVRLEWTEDMAKARRANDARRERAARAASDARVRLRAALDAAGIVGVVTVTGDGVAVNHVSTEHANLLAGLLERPPS